MVTIREDFSLLVVTLESVPEFNTIPPPETPHFVPEGLRARLRFAARGGWLLSRSLERLGRADPNLDPQARYHAQREVARRLLAHLEVDLQIGGAQHLGRGPYVVLALHESLVDGLCLLQLGLPMRFVVRAEIYRWPHIGAALTRMRHARVEPEQGAGAYRTMLRAARDSLASGENFVVFPQGTVLGIEAAFRAGASRLARALHAPLLPVVLTGTHRIWEHPFSATLRYGVRVGMQVMPPLSVADVMAKPAATLCAALEASMKRVALSGRLPAPRRYVPERDGYWDGYSFDIDAAFPALCDQLQRHRDTRVAHPQR
ncbi:MAG: lysophospholipid acyltransferase family protein [Steroidobacteraceae bacterium]|nr:lysophospholipid acyltransferase family protein [Steroidobacteraceae bacterium]